MKNVFTKVLLAMLIFAPVFCYGQKSPRLKKAEIKRGTETKLAAAMPLADFIPLAEANKFIKRLSNELVYDIPSAWLFEKDSILKIIDNNLAKENVSGIRLYFGINNQRDSSLDTLTLIMVGTKLNNGLHIDLTQGKMLEFSQLCPRFCSYNNQNTQVYKRKNEVVPISYFIDRSVLDNLFQDPIVKGVRFRQRKVGNLVSFDIVPCKIETIQGIVYYNDIDSALVKDSAEICLFNNVGNCHLGSPLYKSRTK